MSVLKLVTIIALFFYSTSSISQEIAPLINIGYNTSLYDTEAFEKSLKILENEQQKFENNATTQIPGRSILRLYTDPRQKQSREQQRSIYLIDSLLYLKDLYPTKFYGDRSTVINKTRKQYAKGDLFNIPRNQLEWKNFESRTSATDIKEVKYKTDRKIISGYDCYKVVITMSSPFVINGNTLSKYNRDNVSITMYVTERLHQIKYHPSLSNAIDLSFYYPLEIEIKDKNFEGKHTTSYVID